MVKIDSRRYDFHTPERYAYRSKKGLDEDVIREISSLKKEPRWMLEKRFESYAHFLDANMPRFGPDLSSLDFSDLYYYVRPSVKKEQSWDKVPQEIKKTFDRLGIPETERKFLAGSTAQFESEAVYHHLKRQWGEKGIIFTDMDSGLREYPEIVRKHFGTVVPLNDNKFASLNSAVWSGGSFVYVPKGVKCEIPLQAYYRINTEKMGQFERTLIIADEGSSVHYVEGCFTKGTSIQTTDGDKPIEEITPGERVLSHTGQYKRVRHTQSRPFTGNLYRIQIYGNPREPIEATEEHPFLCIERESANEKNKRWKAAWKKAGELKEKDYLALPRNKTLRVADFFDIEVEDRRKGRAPFAKVRIPSNKDFFRLAGYFLSEGSISSGAYLNFSFGSHEKKYINDVKRLLGRVFGIKKIAEHTHKTNRGTSLVVSSVKMCRAFDSMFGKGSHNKKIPRWMLCEDTEKQKQLIIGLFLGDGNYYRKNTPAHGFLKESLRLNTTSLILAKQTRDILIRIGIPAFINSQDRRKEGRKTMYTVGVTGCYLSELGKLFGMNISAMMHGKNRASMFHLDENYMYMPIRRIERVPVERLTVYNFSVEDDESYVANNAAVHNCSAPVYTAASLHSAVVEVIAKKNSDVRYTTIQNWSNNVYNLVTKRAIAHENARVEWLDGNIGSRVTMKYPCIVLKGEGARGEVLSVAFAGKGQHMDAGAKMIHLAPNTTSRIMSKSISQGGGRSSYRGLVRVKSGATGCKSFVQCDAYILDSLSRSDTYPSIRSDEDSATIGHEAKVGRIGQDKLFYLMSRGISEKDAPAMIVLGFIDSFTKELPMEYAVELNRLIEMQLGEAVA